MSTAILPKSKLYESLDYLREITLAISAVVELNTIIVDSDLNKLVDSEFMDDGIAPIPPTTVAAQALARGKTMLVTDSVGNELCINCPDHTPCMDKAQIVMPIRSEGETAGVIVLNARTEEQRDRLISSSESYIEFLSKMANAIALKIVSEERYRKIQHLEEQLMKVVNEVEHGIVHVDKQRNVRFFNDVANRYLNRVLYTGISIDTAIPEAAGMCISSRPFVFTRNSVTYLAKTKRMDQSGALLDIQRIEEIRDREKEVRQQLHARSNVAKISFTDIIGNSPKIIEVIRAAQKFASSDGTVLISADTGTGKELFAQGIHNASSRKNNPFVAINCSAIPRDLLESELFGYVPGAFTGARKQGKTGLFEQAHGGTIFLDEIGDMPLPLQASMLRVLQEKEVRRIGDDKVTPVDVRVIAATNKDLNDLVAREKFRKDLYYRLNILVLKLPLLANRREDIPLLADHFIKQISEDCGLNQVNFTPRCFRLLQAYSWPGNVRELENVIQRVVLLAEGVDNFEDVVESVMLPLLGDEEESAQQFRLTLDGSYKNLQQQIIAQVLETTSSKEEAAKVLGISSRTLYRKLKEFPAAG